ncbi:hypothetical protein [Hungatella sp.]|uniref:hypothetical protein n=1 Tax=Hungatella sp. TaxID=2613924 RepID=UPI0039940B82
MPVVKDGDTVKAGDRIAACPEKSLGSSFTPPYLESSLSILTDSISRFAPERNGTTKRKGE